jgi:hypothetical protein
VSPRRLRGASRGEDPSSVGQLMRRWSKACKKAGSERRRRVSLSTLRCRPGAASGSLAWTCLGESWICGVPPVWSSAVVCETASPAPRWRYLTQD